MIESALDRLPVLTEVVDAQAVQAAPTRDTPVSGPALQDALVQALPALVRDALQELQPQLEQQLLDALMPRLMATLAQWPSDATDAASRGGQRLP